MRNRFFFIILASLILSAIAINGVTIYFFRNQRIDLIDSQIRKSSTALMNSRESIESAGDSARIEDLISKILGADRIGKVFILRGRRGPPLYQSTNMAPLQVELPTTPDWVTVEAGEQYVRIFNIKLNHGKILQVGLVLDKNFLHWTIVDMKTSVFVAAIVMTLFGISALLTLVLLAPIRMLNSHLKTATSDLKNLKDVDQLPQGLIRFAGGFWSRADEFSTLIETTKRLIDRINSNYKLTRTWTLQMAHELKTPLAIIRAETESFQRKLPPHFVATVLREVDWTSHTITQFLSWAELENSRPDENLHIFRMWHSLQSVHARLDKLTPGRIDTHLITDFSVAARPAHLDQLLTNLLTNALKFSPPSSKVRVTIKDHELIIEDEGPGIPKEVIDRLGQPFNIGLGKNKSDKVGSGLGLAWVSTVSKLYGWHLEVRATNHGTRVDLKFTPLE